MCLDVSVLTRRPVKSENSILLLPGDGAMLGTSVCLKRFVGVKKPHGGSHKYKEK